MPNTDIERLKAAANSPGYGTGRRARLFIEAERKAVNALPDPSLMPRVMASTDAGANWLICSFGYDEETESEWHLTTDNVRASETLALEMPGSAKTDAEGVAAILNAYRLGKLVRIK